MRESDLCTAFCHGCVCHLDSGHTGHMHECLCGGSWDDQGFVHAWPNENPDTGETIAQIAAGDPVLAARYAQRPTLPYRDPLLQFGYKGSRSPS